MLNEDKKLELLLIGTGTSSQVPSIACLTQPREEDSCECCRSKDMKNQRRNTSGILRVYSDSEPDRPKHILIDAGKSFCEAARDHFAKNKIRELSAVVLTHPHADAVNGLDDLRAWTLGGEIQKTIPIYCNQYTLSEISKAYGYLVDTTSRTGGGDVPSFEWHVIEDDVPFEVLGVRIAPLPVHHGTFFGDNPKPYICLAFLFDRSILYMSDVSYIPDSTFELIDQLMFPVQKLPVLVVDTLRVANHSSHFGIAQSIHAAKRLSASKTYLLGFGHQVSHACWEHCCEAISRGELPSKEELPAADPRYHKGLIENFDWFTQNALRTIYSEDSGLTEEDSKGIWVRPAYDGLWLTVKGGFAEDNGYCKLAIQ
ncbi:beta-lactamase-like protein [Phakopsora pachyrhizi]|uniref:Beta-lactamase-like protein n=1 Tax=Phakopsora pachyrhizi TaxID=170000 RepID=A0AAV0APT0_PHAPC|nr:beta-lactamase-like protein [Phakopsora pachyrhizi]CAH7671070.1 beta-lactamase-like protein [Phakopsora pachyrhizi]